MKEAPKEAPAAGPWRRLKDQTPPNSERLYLVRYRTGYRGGLGYGYAIDKWMMTTWNSTCRVTHWAEIYAPIL